MGSTTGIVKQGGNLSQIERGQTTTLHGKARGTGGGGMEKAKGREEERKRI